MVSSKVLRDDDSWGENRLAHTCYGRSGFKLKCITWRRWWQHPLIKPSTITLDGGVLFVCISLQSGTTHCSGLCTGCVCGHSLTPEPTRNQNFSHSLHLIQTWFSFWVDQIDAEFSPTGRFSFVSFTPKGVVFLSQGKTFDIYDISRALTHTL